MTDCDDKTPMETSGSDEKPDKQTLLAVLQVLKKYNLTDTEAQLKKEAEVTEDEVKAEAVKSSQSDVSQVLAAYKSEGDPTLYENQYTILKSFVESSLDVHKCELSMVLYPVFVHMYLELVYNNHENEAKTFFEKYSGDQEEYYQDDLRQLATVTKSEHMRGNQLLENFKSTTFTIRMSRDSYNHLKRHLLEKKHNMLLSIVQDHMFIDVFDGAPRTKMHVDATFGGMLGEAKKDANKVKVYYGLLKEPDINIQLEDEEEAEPAEEKPKSRRRAKKDPQLLKKSKSDPNAPLLTRIPLPELRDCDKIEKARSYREAMKRVVVSAESPPSICFYTLLNTQQGVTSVDISEDSNMIAAGFSDSRIRVWSALPGKLRTMKKTDDLNNIDRESDDVLERMMEDRSATEHRTLHGHSGPVYSTSYSPDRNLMVSASEDGTIRLWSLQTWTNLVCYKGHIYPVWDVKFSPHGHYFASCGLDRTARLWTTDHPQAIRIFSGHLADVDAIQFHPNSNYIATGSTDRTVRLWDISNGNCVRVMTGHKAPIHTLMFSPDGKQLVSAGEDQHCLVWDISSGEMMGQMKGHTDTIYTMAYSRDGAVMATGGLDNAVRLWDMNKVVEDASEDGLIGSLNEASNYEIACFPTKKTPVLHVHFTRRNMLLACGPYT